MSKQYESAGVSLNKGYETIKRIQKHTNNIGDFGGAFDLSRFGYKEPVLVSGTDGVGTKLKVAMMANEHDTIGIDLVAMCANDIITQGARPLFFLDYFSTSNLNPDIVEEVIKGIVEGCKQSDALLIGGETAEMPGMYKAGEYDLAGFMVGAVEKQKILSKEAVKLDDVIIGLPSSGIHSNGYSLVRKVLFDDHSLDINKTYQPCENPLKDELLIPTKIYVKALATILEKIDVHSIAHITGGGFYENIPRALPRGLGVEIDTSTFTIPSIFSLIEKLGNIDHKEMFNIFNMGIGMILIVNPEDAQKTLELLKEDKAVIIGKVTASSEVVLKW